MIIARPAAARGRTDRGWLDAWHSFSFGDYQDAAETGWGALRVLNEDRLGPGRGFGMHGHSNMEILTLILDGELEHKDGHDNEVIIGAGAVQCMSCGLGMLHSEFNSSFKNPLHLLQIWIEPRERDAEPGYQQKDFAPQARRDRLCLIASADGREDSLVINQDAALYTAQLSAGQSLRHALADPRRAYLHVVRGAVTLNGQPLQDGDGAKIAEESELDIVAREEAEILLFDLPA